MCLILITGNRDLFSHFDPVQMAIIFSAEDLKDVKPPCVIQSFINHNAVLYKVFVVGESYTVVERPSLKNFPFGPSGKCTRSLSITSVKGAVGYVITPPSDSLCCHDLRAEKIRCLPGSLCMKMMAEIVSLSSEVRCPQPPSGLLHMPVRMESM